MTQEALKLALEALELILLNGELFMAHGWMTLREILKPWSRRRTPHHNLIML